ncbi:hypothetical protein SAMN05216198_1522 [Halopseudomonas litoralis]|uniref:Uncharacterized protein n=1 Tax=Halopseudomonas litoralis TaxID=797277 RepID=A0A1H1QLS3_9GAMM|nr:hypothetical protein [Halopseudomonas litoralis]SDS24394.1 hypothetical protein SAMN05216198_1522 [Halopseudomonas litoralis]
MTDQISFDQMVGAVEQAHTTIRRADRVAGQMARLLRGRLRSADIPNYILRDLKKELRDFNMHTGEWKS